MLLDFLERLASIEKKSEFVRRERFKRKQVSKPMGHIFTLTF
jgi:tetrahydromethanopterin S-methyltransferase subunit G